MPDNPYQHFNDLQSRCYMRLWELEAGDGEGVDRQAFHNPELGEWDEIMEMDTDSEDDDLPPENFDDFRGERPFEDEDTSDEEPAPDQRRNMHIEIVNFARPGGNNAQRIALPERPRAPEPAPPAVPNPPRRRRRGGGQQGNRQRAMRNEPARAMVDAQPPPRRQEAPRNPAQNVAAGDGDLPVLPQAAPGQGNHAGGAMQPGPVRAMGLERFLQLAQQDEEDEWDSDELDEDFDELRLAEPRRQRVDWR